MEVAPLPADVLMLLGALSDGFAASLAALLAATHAPLGFLELLLGLAIVAGVLDSAAGCRDEEHLQHRQG
jgi:hypothetical protein